MWGLSGSVDWRTDLDHDGYDWGDAASPFKLNGTNYSSLTSFSSTTRQERKGLRISRLTCLPTLNVPGDSAITVPPQYLTLAAGCPAIDAGAILPGVNDGFLRLDEVTRLRLNADLVVLSACRTGQGRLYSGEGVTGLARAFLYAGSRGVVSSLWSVDDRETADRRATGTAGCFVFLDLRAHVVPVDCVNVQSI